MEESRYTVTGIAFPKLQDGSGPQDKSIRSDVTNRQSFYHDPVMHLTEDDIKAFDGLRNVPLHVEHNMNDCVGEILEARVLK
jgi:hypothetical protein